MRDVIGALLFASGLFVLIRRVIFITSTVRRIKGDERARRAHELGAPQD